ncbi:MAG TPA: A24 family peptidase [Nitrosomonas sp.]|nr:A24 family peptidase [Nitrosomonas sp.]HQX13545.1 A24 family peptidase [Nitrosomonas sp.]HRB21118.1 A24 family peptidase [Nitrosomonas sp.]HRB32931.1 A24 family peptidase [Nitrosomonas sp.]HRB45592.1 A24 family peptidase [Nitrosomonas sp.]
MTFITQLQDTPVLFMSMITIIGLMVGSFLNVVIYRLPEMIKRDWLQQCAELRGETLSSSEKFNLMVPRSACTHCGHKITALENIPIISYIALRGRCAQCKKSISLRYPLIEVLTALMSGLVAWHFGFSLLTLAALIFVWALIALAVIDLNTQLLPDDITLPLLWLGILVNLNNGFTDINSSVIGAVVGYLSLWSIYWCFKLLTGKEGMGYGDFKLLAAIGAWLGWAMLPLVIIFSSLIGAVVGISLILKSKHDKNSTIPFGPYLAGGALVALFAGEKINQMYLGLF